MNEKVLNYACLEHFNSIENEGLLDYTHLSERVSVHLRKLTYADGGEDEINLFAWHFLKDGKEYLVPMKNPDGSMIKLEEILPLRVKGNPQLVAHQGRVYNLVEPQNYTVLKYRPEKAYTFKEVVDKLSVIPHKYPLQKKLFTIMGLASYLGVCHYRVSTPPGFGKDSLVDTLGFLLGDTATLVNPSISKFEREISINKLVALSEITKIKKADWDGIGMILLDCAAQKTSIKKRTRKFGGVGEDIDLTDLSVVLLYNDITEYSTIKTKKYFDFVADGNLVDRFPAFRFTGGITYDFAGDDDVDFGRLARENQIELRNIIKSLLYYKSNWRQEYTGYNYSLEGVKQRDAVNLTRILRFLDLYSESQEEFDRLYKVLQNAMMEYKSMIAYSRLEDAYKDRFGKIKWSSFEKEHLRDCEFFRDRVKMVSDALSGKEPVKSRKLEEW